VAKRLFIAVDIDERTRDEIGAISRALRAALGPRVNASWVHPDRMHLTLCFFGTADAALEHRVTEALVGPIGEHPFDLSFDGLGSFPERGSPRVLWLGVRRGGRELRGIQQMLQHRLEVPPEREEFRPHLTLARIKDRVPRAEVAKIADMAASAGPSRIDRVTLYESRLSPQGPIYVQIAEAPLQP
jgi:2'-5' RNA ligase